MFYQAVVAKGSVTKYGKRKGEIRGGEGGGRGVPESFESLRGARFCQLTRFFLTV